MRWPVLFLVAILASCGAFTRTSAVPGRSAAASVALTSTTSAPRPSASAVTVTVRYVAIGASDTFVVGASDPATGSWPARVASFLPPGSAFVNLGVSGSVAAQARDQQVPAAIAQRPSVVSVWLAVNDMNASVAPPAYRDALGAIVDALVARTDASVFVGNVPDIRGVPAYKDVDKALLAAQISAYNDAIASVVASHGGRAFVVDLYSGSAPLVSTI